MKQGERVFNWILLALSIVFCLLSLSITPVTELTLTSDGAYPLFISCLSLLFALCILLDSRKRRRAGASQSDGPEEQPVFCRDVVVMILFVIIYAAAILVVHYILATLLFTILSISYLEQWKWRRGLLIGFTSTFWIVLIFKYFFSVILP